MRRTRRANSSIKRCDRRSQTACQFEIDRVVALKVEAQSSVDHLRGGKLHSVDLSLQRFEKGQRVSEFHRPDHPGAPRLQENTAHFVVPKFRHEGREPLSDNAGENAVCICFRVSRTRQEPLSATLASRTKRCARTLIAHLLEKISATHAFRQRPGARHLSHDCAGSFLASSQINAVFRMQQDNAWCHDKAGDAFRCIHGGEFGIAMAKV